MDEAGLPIVPVDGLPTCDKQHNKEFAEKSQLWLHKLREKLQENGHEKAFDSNDKVDIKICRDEGLVLCAKLVLLGKLELQKEISAKLIDHSLVTSDKQELQNLDQLYDIMAEKKSMVQYNHNMIGFLLTLHKIVITLKRNPHGKLRWPIDFVRCTNAHTKSLFYTTTQKRFHCLLWIVSGTTMKFVGEKFQGCCNRVYGCGVRSQA